MPQIESYDGAKDLLDHLETFKTLMHLQGVVDEIMCKAFLTTLKGLTRIWFSRLMPNSISTFKELSAQFTSHFIGGHRYKKFTIKALIKQEKLKKFVSKERTDPPSQEQAPQQDYKRPKSPLGDIRMIVGGTTNTDSSKKGRKTYLGMVQNVQLASVVPKMPRVDNPIIGFLKEDARHLYHPHDDALVVSIQVRDYNTYRVLVDNGSSTNILYYSAFQQMQIDREHLVPTNAPLVGFGGIKVMSYPEAIGRLTLRAIELSEFDIQYRLCTAIKGQVVADFIAEFTNGEDKGANECL
ncbi:uncharacterized protein LOC112039315 [Quercus suber]|uniref:uncharacterized protein LOC112039315 n=1 Tax=Quercus suber TaxID=58331 RepID=UPI000CE19F5A|nr:uncharacterized protein LOC112039315 [Quercus suber]